MKEFDLMLRQSSASTRELTTQARERYSKGGEIFMEGIPDMSSQPTNSEVPQTSRSGVEKPVSAERQEQTRRLWEEASKGRIISVSERRTIDELVKRGLAPVIGGAEGIGKTGIPAIDAEIDAMNNTLDTKLKAPLGVYLEAVVNISRLTGVDDVAKQSVINKIKDAIREAYKESERDRPVEEQERRYTLYFTPAEQASLRKDPTEWLDKQFDILYGFAEEGQELSSPIINGVQQQVSQAVDFVKNYRPEIMSDFLTQYTVRLHLLQMRTAIGYRSIENIKQAAHELRFHGLLAGMTLEKGMVGAMFNRFQDLLENSRLSSNTRHHVMLEDAYKLQKILIDEQMDFAKKGLGDFDDLSDISTKEAKDQNPNNSDTWDDFTWAAKMTDKQIKENEKMSEEQKERIMRIKSINASITRSVRTAYDVFVSSQRMAVVVARGRYLLKDSSRYRSDPIGPLNVYNMEELLFEKFDMYSPQQEELMNRIRLDMADSYLEDQKKNKEGEQETLTEEQKLDLGKRLFRDIFAVPDFFSSGWRIEGVIQALEQRFESLSLEDLQKQWSDEKLREELYKGLDTESDKKKAEEECNKYKSTSNTSSVGEKRKFLAKKTAEEFALFMRLRGTGQEQLSSSGTEKSKKETRDKRKKVWRKIQDYRPEEIIRLFRERKGDKVKTLYDEMIKTDPKLKLTDIEERANRPESEDGGRGRDITVYDKFKEKYGPVIGLLRQEGFNFVDSKGNPKFPTQINLSKLTDEQKAVVDKFFSGKTGNDSGSGQQLAELSAKMQEFIVNEEFVNDLLTDNSFADVYTRSIIVDDALLDKLEDEKAKNGDNLGYAPLSKIIGEAGAGGDTLVRSWTDTENAAKAGNALLKFIKEEDLEKKTNAALEFAGSASMYNGLGAKGQAEGVRHTIGTYLNLSKLDMAWDIVGINSLPLRIPASDAQRIFGVQAKAMSRDELRESLDHLRGFLTSSITKDREKLQEDLKAVKNSTTLKDMEKKEKEEELLGKFNKNKKDAQKFYKNMEDLLEVTGKDFWKRTGFRLLLYLMLAAIGETYMAAKSSTSK